MIDPSSEPHQCLLTDMWMWKRMAAMVATERSAGVTPKVKFRKNVAYTTIPSLNKAAHSGFET